MSLRTKVIGATLLVLVTGVSLVLLKDDPPAPKSDRVSDREYFENLSRYRGTYPKACLERPSSPRRKGLIATFDQGEVTISNLDGEEVGSIEHTRLPIGWNEAGTLIAAGPRGHIWTPEGEPAHILGGHALLSSTGKKTEWSWSPVSSCLLNVFPARGGSLLAARVGHRGRPKVLIKGGVETFAFAPDGRSVAVWIDIRSINGIFIADLEANAMQEIHPLPEETCCVTFAGWTPDGQEVLFWARPGESSAGRGWMLESAGVDGEVKTHAPMMIPDPSFVETCGDRVAAIVGGGPPDYMYRKFAFLRPDRKPKHVEPFRGLHLWPACSPDGERVAFVRDRRSAQAEPMLVFVGTKEPVNLDLPGPAEWLEWSDEGLLYSVREGNSCSLWLMSEALHQTSVGLSVSCLDVDKAQTFDWSTTPPDGLPIRRSREGA